MKRIFMATISAALMLINVSAVSSEELKSATTYLSVLNVREDLINKKTTNEILVIGKYSEGKYDLVSHWDAKKQTLISQRKSILEQHKSFKAYHQGSIIGEISVSQICTSVFDCEELVVGASQGGNLIDDISKYEQHTTETSGGFNQYGNFEYKNTRFIAINSDSPNIVTQRNSKPLTNKISDESKKLITGFVVKELLRDSELKEKDITIASLLSYDLNDDNNIEYLVVAKGENDITKESRIYVLNLIANHVMPLLNEGMENRPSSWGNGYDLLDVLDIDGDKIPELIFETKGYESTGYDIFKLENNKFIKVFSDVTYGC